jgi:hypothetical protein
MRFSERLERAQEAWGAWVDVQPRAEKLRLDMTVRTAFHAGFMMGATARANDRGRRRPWWRGTR